MSTEPAKPTPAPDAASNRPRGVKIFTYPKVIYMYPSGIMALICGFAMLFMETDPKAAEAKDADKAAAVQAAAEVPATPAEAAAPAEDQAKAAEATAVATEPAAAAKKKSDFGRLQNIFAVLFLGTLGVNLVVMALDFPRFGFVTIGLLVICIGLLLFALVEAGFNVAGFFTFIFGGLYLTANHAFYFVYAAIYAIVLGMIWVTRYLDYWEIRPNEILHHHGPLSDLERFPTINLRFDKEIPDIFEFMLAGAGRLVLNIQGEPKVYVLDNVPRINKVEASLKDLMGRLKVTVGDSN
jgi:hypothetical protein